MKLGTTNLYNKAQLISFLKIPTGNDAIRKLAQQLIAAKLNLASGSDASLIRSTIIAADDLIGERAIAAIPKITPNTLDGKKMMSLTIALEAFNSGILNRGCNGHTGFSQNDHIDNSTISYSSLSVVPNPFSNTATISYSIPQKGTAVATGMYFLKMQAGSYTVTKRIVVEN